MTKPEYCCYFEVQLEREDFGLSREEHNALCNHMLLQQLALFSQDGRQFCDEFTNEELVKGITLDPTRPPNNFFVWEHCSSSTANGRVGVMRLIPRHQHHPASKYWRIIHPDYKKRGGYHEWAIPAGAPTGLLKEDAIRLKNIDLNKVSAVSIANLPDYFKKAVFTNNFEGFKRIIKRAIELGCSPENLQEILCQNYTIGAFAKKTTLLHVAAKAGYEPLINTLLKFTTTQPEFLNQRDRDLDTAAHVAAEHNRSRVLKKLILSGTNVLLKNKKGETVEDILLTRRFNVSLKHYNEALEQMHSPITKATPDDFQQKTPPWPQIPIFNQFKQPYFKMPLQVTHPYFQIHPSLLQNTFKKVTAKHDANRWFAHQSLSRPHKSEPIARLKHNFWNEKNKNLARALQQQIPASRPTAKLGTVFHYICRR